MAVVNITVINDSGKTVIADSRSLITLLAKGGSKPAGAVLQAIGQSTTYWFGKVPASVPWSYGAQILDTDGTTVLFDALSYGKMARPVGVITGTLGTGEPDITVTKTFAIPAGKVYACCVHKMPSAFRIRNVPFQLGGTTQYYYAMDEQLVDVSVTSSLITITARRINGNPGSPSAVPYSETGSDPVFRAIVLDVTNY
jgi:hypothetical protein